MSPQIKHLFDFKQTFNQYNFVNGADEEGWQAFGGGLFQP